MDFRPTLPPPGRLVRLGLIMDTRDGWARLSETARMCDGSGIDALWLQDRLASGELGADGDALPKEAWTVLSVLSRDVRRARMGAILNPAFRPPAVLAAMARTLDDALGGRLELSLTAGSHEAEHLALGLDYPDEVASWHGAEGYAAIVRGLVSGPTVAIVGDTPAAFDVAARVADDVVLPPSDPAGVAHLVRQLHEACDRSGRGPETIGIAVVVPVSIGRTTAEASARADTDDRFRRVGDPRHVGVFGTLEQCQERVIELAHAGVTDLRCLVPNAPDMPDVLAQLTSISIGTVDVLTPGSPRSKSPDPPEGWGGRA
jgi:alkanesulfonate monooxygenase SsuD/methylene tetrahydromethanopterin reductase-like flavin-dependent oxidoreductase (luciferase family)